MKKIIVGIILVGAIFIAGIQVKNIFFNKNQVKVFESNEDISELIVEDHNTPIKIIGTDATGPVIRIRYFETNRSKYSIDQYDETLEMIKDESWSLFSWNLFGGFSFSDDTVSIEVSQAALDQLMISSSNSEITVENLKLDNAEFDTSNDNITLTDLSVDNELYACTSNAEVSLRNTKADIISVDTSNDSITFDEVAVGETLFGETSNGSIEGTIVGKRDDFMINTDTSNGDNSLGITSKGKKTLELYTSNDDITVHFLD